MEYINAPCFLLTVLSEVYSVVSLRVFAEIIHIKRLRGYHISLTGEVKEEKKKDMGSPWWATGSDSTLPLQRA